MDSTSLYIVNAGSANVFNTTGGVFFAAAVVENFDAHVGGSEILLGAGDGVFQADIFEEASALGLGSDLDCLSASSSGETGR